LNAGDEIFSDHSINAATQNDVMALLQQYIAEIDAAYKQRMIT